MNGTSKELMGVYSESTPISSIYQGITLVWCKPSDEPINELIFDVEINSRQFYIPLEPVGEMTGVVDWGDGKTEEITMNSYPNYTKYHTYTNLGDYRVTFTLTSGEYNICDNRYSSNTNRITRVISYGNQYLTKFLFYNANKVNSLPKNYPFKDGAFKLSNDEYEGVVNFDGLFANTTKMGEISNCSFTRIEGDMFKGNDAIEYAYNECIVDCPNLEYIENIYLPNYISATPITDGCSKLHTINTVTMPLNHGSFDMGLILFGQSGGSSLRKMTITNLSDYTQYTVIKFDQLTNWGVNSTTVPKAKQSLVDSLITNTTDKSGEAKALSIYLSTNTKNALTSEEKAQITAKGYTIA